MAVGQFERPVVDAILRDMETYTITPHGREYWIEALAEDGTYRQIEAQPTEEDAWQRLRILVSQAGATERLAWHTRRVWPF